MVNSIKTEMDDVIINRKEQVSIDNFYGKNQVNANQLQALNCVRYVIEDILQWDIDTAKLKFDDSILKRFNLYPVLDYIEYPDEIEKYDTYYILSLLYPKKIRLNYEDIVKNTLDKVFSGERSQFPRDYFAGALGFKRFCYCIKFIVEENLTFTSISEIYDFFDNAIKKRDTLLTSRLRIPIYHYKIDLYEVIYTITKDYEDAELWYSYYCFNRAIKESNANEE